MQITGVYERNMEDLGQTNLQNLPLEIWPPNINRKIRSSVTSKFHNQSISMDGQLDAPDAYEEKPLEQDQFLIETTKKPSKSAKSENWILGPLTPKICKNVKYLTVSCPPWWVDPKTVGITLLLRILGSWGPKDWFWDVTECDSDTLY